MVWDSHLFKNFPQFFVIHRDKGFGIADITEVDVLLELSCFFNDPVDVGNLISGSSAFSKSSGSHTVEEWQENFSIPLLAYEKSATVW